jgi:thiamine biosynthesis lipoprotein
VPRRPPFVLFCCALAACASAPLQRFEFARAAMGTEFHLSFFAPDAGRAAAAAEAAFARIAALDSALSDYDPESELSRLGARSDGGAPTAWIPVSAELFELLATAEDVARASGGAFDVTIGPCTHLWRRAQRQGELPDDVRLERALGAVGHGKLALDRRARSVRLLAPAMRLDPGGIGKGFALDEALRVLAGHGIERALVVGGGDVAAGAGPPGRAGWNVAVAGLDSVEPAHDRAAAALVLAHAALSTSGDLVRSFELGGVRYAHILDPRTGRALTERRLASVLAPSAARADAWATALAVLGPPGLAALAREPLSAGRVAVLGPDGVALFESPGFPRVLSCEPAPERGALRAR